MDRWLTTFFIGAILSLFMPIVPVFFYVSFFTFVGCLFLTHKNARWVSGLFLGMAWIVFHGMQYQQIWDVNNIDKNQLFDGGSVSVVEGEVTEIPREKSYLQAYRQQSSKTSVSAKFTFKVSHLNHQLLTSPFLIRLNWHHVEQKINQGNKWRLYVKLKPAHGFANTGGFNYKMWLRQKNIAATGYVVHYKTNELLSFDSSSRQVLFERSLTLLPKHELSPLLTALSFGEKNDIPQALWHVLQKTNTQHLIAISGLHLGLIAAGSFFLFSFLIRVIPIKLLLLRTKTMVYLSCFLSRNSKLVVILLSCSLTFYYAYLAGFALPTVRALIMLLFFWGSRLIGIKLSLFTWLLLTVFIVLLTEPMSLISGSFWLSFYAVSVIFIILWRFNYLFDGTNKVIRWLKSLFYIQLGLSFFMLPLSLLFNYQLSLISILANLVAVPVMSFTSIPLCLMAVLAMPLSHDLSSFFYELALTSTSYLWQYLVFLSQQPWAAIDVSFVDIILISVCVFLVVSIYFILPSSKMFLLLCITLVGGFLFITPSQQTSWKVVVLDVGQGLSVIIEKNNHAILYDTGASYPSGFNMIDAVVLPYLKHRGINKLDKVFISHSDNDHAGGLERLRQHIVIDEVIASDPKLEGDKKCDQSYQVTWQGVSLSTLWPPKGNQYIGNNNDHSCVIRVSDVNGSVLLTGDISSEVEKQLVNNENVLLNSDAMLAPHHGSNTSSSDLFIKAVSPKYVVYSAGFMNRWHMPTVAVKKRYQENNVEAYNTAETGMVEINIMLDNSGEDPNNVMNKTLTVMPYKQATFPFWFAH